MTAMSNAQLLPRALVSGYLRVARLPLTAVERVAKQQDNEQWPPALAYESFEAGVETTVGSLLRDPALVERGRLRQAKIAQLRKAAELGTLAEQEQVQAEEKLGQRREQVAEQRKETARRAEQRKQDLERQAELHERKVKEKAAKKAATARKVKATQDKVIDRQARTAKAGALKSEARALSLAKEAIDAEETVQVIDESIEGTKVARKTS
jgi:hypothetical protein